MPNDSGRITHSILMSSEVKFCPPLAMVYDIQIAAALGLEVGLGGNLGTLAEDKNSNILQFSLKTKKSNTCNVTVR